MRLKEEYTHTIEIEKSKFITYMNRCFNEEEARHYIQSIKKLHPTATHHCTAFLCQNRQIMRSNDDGEPAKTAGAPMLNVLINSDIDDICVVVVRYFGGIKLGTGGLIKAYTRSVKETLEQAKKVDTKSVSFYTLTFSYDLINILEYYLKETAYIIEKQYEQDVRYTFYTQHPSILEDIKELTKGQFLPVFIKTEVIEVEQ
ncbi:MAG: YigZ family protein [Erysipelotrichaceae bacterium]|nr:YigZ family protein [Erysipelotrichaceae bacterium]